MLRGTESVSAVRSILLSVRYVECCYGEFGERVEILHGHDTQVTLFFLRWYDLVRCDWDKLLETHGSGILCRKLAVILFVDFITGQVYRGIILDYQHNSDIFNV